MDGQASAPKKTLKIMENLTKSQKYILLVILVLFTLGGVFLFIKSKKTDAKDKKMNTTEIEPLLDYIQPPNLPQTDPPAITPVVTANTTETLIISPSFDFVTKILTYTMSYDSSTTTGTVSSKVLKMGMQPILDVKPFGLFRVALVADTTDLVELVIIAKGVAIKEKRVNMTTGAILSIK